MHTISITILPRHVELGEPTYPTRLNRANELINTKLKHVGPLERWGNAGETNGKRFKAKARFRDEEDARKAVESLHGTLLPFSRGGKLTVQRVYSAKFKILERVFQAVRAIIEAQRRIWDSQKLRFTSYNPALGYRALKLEGEDSKTFAQAKNSPSFGINGDVYSKLKTVEQTLGVAIVRNQRQSCIHIYGPPEKCKEAQVRIAALIGDDSSTARTVGLDQSQFAWACRGDFKSILSVLGEGVATSDIISSPKRILVTGSDGNFQLALNIVTNQKEPERRVKENTTDEDCAICWTEAETPVRTQCEHTYCAGCFERLCFSGTTGNKELCIR
ncbi:hypothetical protein BBP40_006670 [Aspergillus hancockii]|nr:hypothetical protein BBP40_006670 [Aspergillus hancockii]